MKHVASSSNEAAIAVAQELKEKYQALLKTVGKRQEVKSELTAGQMLFLAFDSLFNSVDEALKELRIHMLSFEIPAEWRGIEAFETCDRITAETLNPSLFELQESITFTKRMSVVSNFFAMCKKSMLCFKADGAENFVTGDDLVRPVKAFLTGNASSYLH